MSDRRLGPRARRLLGTLAFTVGLPANGPALLAGQVVLHGFVTDQATGRGVSGVELLLEAGGVLGTSDSTGSYRVTIPFGRHVLLARRIGFAPWRADVGFTRAEEIRLDISLTPVATELPAIEVVEPRPGWRGEFDDRRRIGNGFFLDSTALRSGEHRNLADMLRVAPNARVVTAGRGNILMGRGTFTALCPMAVWLDGLRVFAPSSTGGGIPPPDLSQWSVRELEAVEVYSLAQTPARFAGTGASCGTVLLWTRRR